MAALLLASAALPGAGPVPLDEDTPLPELDIPRPYTNNPLKKKYCAVWVEMVLSGSAEPTLANIGVLDVKGDVGKEQVAKEALLGAVNSDNLAHPNLLVAARLQKDQEEKFLVYQYDAIYHEDCNWPEGSE